MGPQAHGPQGNAIAAFLLLHGAGDGPEHWQELVEVLEGRGHEALALSLPADRWVDDVAAVREHVRDGETIVVGHGHSGLVARAYATAHPDTAKGIATIASPPAPDAETKAGLGFDVPGNELRIAVICEGDEVVDYDEQKRSAGEWRAQPGSVPGGHAAHRRHPALVSTLLINWLAPETA